MTINIGKEFSKDHQKVMKSLLEIEKCCDKYDVARIQEIAKYLDKLLGPHFYFEEKDLYPAAKRFLGEKRIKKLMKDHEPVAPTLETLKNLKKLSQKEAKGIKSALTSFYIHVSDCEGITILIAAMRGEKKKKLGLKLEKYRKEIGPLTSWK